MLRSPRDAWSITRAFALKTACRDVADARKVFFGPRVADDDAHAKPESSERLRLILVCPCLSLFSNLKALRVCLALERRR